MFEIDPDLSEVRYEGSFLKLETVAYRSSDGSTLFRDIVRHPGAVVIIPYDASRDEVLLIEQFRVALGRDVIELPAGKRDVLGEDPLDCARRELMEELGLDAQSMVLLSTFYNTPGFCDELTYLFLARGLRQGEISPQGAEETAAVFRSISLNDFEDHITKGTICDAKTIVGLYSLASYLKTTVDEQVNVDDFELDRFRPL
ncbi:NUDIX hydrolase [Acidithrix sp. C25]|uniref:NUDIX hydrolase n=1 Tax=Acidithrix sp. C25 TaxID=1671482 RepID=UPI00191BC362|nr:NUDIX hydrolase [Acidithrix sp. C25]CAG4905646.1 unnamed protein product [Acidithrix sp. C25]